MVELGGEGWGVLQDDGIQDAVGREQGRGFGCNLDRERTNHPAVEPDRRSQWSAAPAKGENLLQPGDFGDAGIGLNIGFERVRRECAHELIAGAAACRRILAAREAEARDFEDVLTGGRRCCTQLPEQVSKNMAPHGGQQPGRSEMIAVLISNDQIRRMFVVEFVELEPAFEHRQVPFEQIDEDAFAVFEHGPERPISRRFFTPVLYDYHDLSGSCFCWSEHRGAALSGIYQEMGVSAAEHVEEADAAIEQGMDCKQGALADPVSFARVLQMLDYGFMADPENPRDFPVRFAAGGPHHALALPVG